MKFIYFLLTILLLSACTTFPDHAPTYSGPKKTNQEVALLVRVLAGHFFSNTTVYTKSVDNQDIRGLSCKGDDGKDIRCPFALGLIDGDHTVVLSILEHENLWFPVWLREKKVDVIYKVNFTSRRGYTYGPLLIPEENDPNKHKVCIAETLTGNSVRESKTFVGCSAPKILADQERHVCFDVFNTRKEKVNNSSNQTLIDVYSNEDCF
ncbi:hypothetical protein [Methylophaga sp. OBS1]|uniref:hypothetical protein n=1 Tax=Methylophaga sp. OBS1 TaxID=2991933 RepID=UPI0022551530|nr:hypothetical protein [Methylophaga sp. OBS1]MCX4191128.1 hypothetical protein [Methylophaga sp. OBS1]MCX4191926.1 hypothetical protein [Methylophaga sp. OBS1]